MVFDENIEREVAAYEKGRQLRTIMNSPGWEVLLDTLKAYRDEAADRLLDMDPGDPNVLTAHAAASALRQQFAFLQADLDNAVKVASSPSPELTQYLVEYRDSLDILKQMETTQNR